MKKKSFTKLFIFAIFFCFGNSHLSYSQNTSDCDLEELSPFSCGEYLYQIEGSQLSEVSFFDGVFINPIGSGSITFPSIDGVAMNAQNQLIYGFGSANDGLDQSLLVMDATGIVCELGILDDYFFDMFRPAATMDLNQNLYITGAGTNVFQKVNVASPPYTVATFTLQNLPGDIVDMVFNPFDEMIYSVTSNGSIFNESFPQLIRIDPITESFEVICTLTSLSPDSYYDAQWLTINEKMVVNDATIGAFYEVDINNCTSSPMDFYTPGTASIDGANCNFIVVNEICDNGLDDDNDGLVDCDDPDCMDDCTTTNSIITYELNNNFEADISNAPQLEVLGTGEFLTSNIGDLGCNPEIVYHFDYNSGLSFPNSNDFLGESYSIEMLFKIEDFSSWNRLIDYKNRTSDNGLYTKSGKVDFYGATSSVATPFAADVYAHLIVTRNQENNEQLIVYVNGGSKLNFNDNNDLAILSESNVLHFFQDDLSFSGEASAGEVALIRLYNYVLNETEVLSIYNELGCEMEENTTLKCGDGIDNDGDGAIDCADADCFCICNGMEDFFDPFDGTTLNSSWEVLTPFTNSNVDLTGTGFLRMEALNAQLIQNTPLPINQAPIVYYPVMPNSNWTIETRVQFDPNLAVVGQAAGLIALADEDPTSSKFTKLIQRTYNYGNSGHGIESANQFIPFTGTDVYLRVTLNGTEFTSYYSTDGVFWTEVATGSLFIYPEVYYVGLYVENGDFSNTIWSVADFDYFDLMSDCEIPPSPCDPVLSDNLIQNPSCDLPLINGNIPFWEEILGNWGQRTSGPDPQHGPAYFFPGTSAEAILSQVVDVSNYETTIDSSQQKFEFQGYVQSYGQSPTDQSQIFLDFLDDDENVLFEYDSGTFDTENFWTEIITLLDAPAGTRKVRIRLNSHRLAGSNNDGYYDNLSLKAYTPPTCEEGPTCADGIDNDGDGLIDCEDSDCDCALSLAIDVIQVTCYGQSTGAILITPTGGTAPYTYQWTPEIASGNNPMNLPAGEYMVTVTDANEEEIVATIEIQQPDEPTISFNVISEVSCSGTTDGAIEVEANGGTPNYSYLWSNGQSTPTATSLTAGIYSVTVLDANQCSVVDSIPLAEGLLTPPAAGFVFTFIDNTTLQFVSNSAGIIDTYSWTVEGNPFGTDSDLVYEFLSPGSYEVCLAVGNQCGMTTYCETIVIENTPLTFYFGTVSGHTGETIQIPVTVDNFMNMAYFSKLIQLENTSIAQLVGISDFILPGELITEVNADGTITLFWGNVLPGNSVPDGTVLFNLDLLITGESASCTTISCVGNPSETAAAQYDGFNLINIPVEVVEGMVCVLPNISIAGTIFTEYLEPVDDVIVNCTNVNPEITDTTGSYLFTDLTNGDDFVLEPEKDMDLLEDVDIMDVRLIIRHILNLQQLDSPYKIIAADIDRSGTVNFIDFILLLNAIFTPGMEFPNNTSWRFVDAGYEFIDPTKPLVEDFPEMIQFDNLEMDTIGADFVGVKIGNVSYDVPEIGTDGVVRNNGSNPTISTRYSGSIPFTLENQWMEIGRNLIVDFRVNNFKDMLSFQMEIDFDPEVMEVVHVIPRELPHLDKNSFGRHFENKGKLFVGWADQSEAFMGNSLEENRIAFSVVFKAKDFGHLKDYLKIGTSYVPSKAYQSIDPGTPNGVALLDLRLTFEETEKSQKPRVKGLILRPNPTRKYVTIDYTLDEQTKVNINLFSLTGYHLQEVMSTEKQNSGRYLKEISLEELPEGIYFIKVHAGKDIWTERVVKIEE